MNYSPMQILRMINRGMKQTVLSSSTIWVCSSCYTCATRCPRDVDFPALMMSLKNKAITEFMARDKSKFHKSFFEVVSKYGKLYEPELFVKLMDKSDFKSLRQNASLGWRLFRKGKMHVKAPRTEQTPWVRSMLEKTKEKEQE